MNGGNLPAILPLTIGPVLFCLFGMSSVYGHMIL